MIAPPRLLMKYATMIEFKVTNNIAEYEGLILGLNKAKALGAKIFLEKIGYALLISSRKLKHYFQAHKIRVPSL